MSDWQPMETAPRDGSSFDVKCRSLSGTEIVILDLHYGYESMRKDNTMILWGRHNTLSPFFTPLGWRPMETKQENKE